MDLIELAVAVLVIAFTTAIATDYLLLPFAAFSSPLAIVIMVIAALGAFRVAPAVGLALFLLTAVLFFKRNAAQLYSAKSAYGDVTIAAEPPSVAQPYTSDASQPRRYDEFNEMDPRNPALGPIREGFANAGGEPAPFGDEAGAPVEGQYPLDAERPSAAPEPRDYVYRPAADSGSNEFVRYGPDLEVKTKVFAY
jgi:hypothetical protein